ncbi:MAG: hypothetical protein AAGI63_12470 [Planctomycetota bacterium]
MHISIAVPASENPAHRQAAAAAETFAMRRMTQTKTSNLFAVMALVLSVTVGTTTVTAQNFAVRQASIDYDSAGYVTPAGMAPPSLYQGGVMPVGYAMACDGYGGACGNGCGDACGGQNCGPFGCGGILGKMTSGNGYGSCGPCSGGICNGCFTFAGYDIGATMCQLLPYSDAGRCAQRWYDLSAEAVFLGHGGGSLQGSLTSLGTGPAGPIVLSMGDAENGDELEAGMRLSAAIIWGVGGNLEATYMGNNQWRSSAFAEDLGGNLFSVISDFGQAPVGGFADTDNQTRQQIDVESEFHSGELNYRRRTVTPDCHFQGSWLVGLRYVRFDNDFIYSGVGGGGQFRSSDAIKNNFFGPQAGFDCWWNVCSGINLGFGLKGAWVQNDFDRSTVLEATSILGNEILVSGDQDTTVMAELEAKLIYRFSHSWSFRTAYYAVAIDDVAFAFADAQSINNFVNANPNPPVPVRFNSLVVQGVSFGTEFMW